MTSIYKNQKKTILHYTPLNYTRHSTPFSGFKLFSPQFQLKRSTDAYGLAGKIFFAKHATATARHTPD
jgi:hypothetical protein